MIRARVMYGEAIRELNMRIQTTRPNQPSSLDDVIGAIQALTPCAWFKCVEAKNLDWMQHTAAVLNILDVYGWQAISPSTRRAFYYNWKYRSFFDSLNKRTEVSFKEPPADPGTIDLSSSFLTDYAFDVSGLLWRSDRFLQARKSRKVNQYMVVRLLTELGRCVGRLKHWYLLWIKQFPPKPHIRTVGTHNFQAFTSLCGKHYGVFPMAYEFSNTLHERDFRIFCLCLLNLDLAIIDVHHAFPQHCEGAELQLQLREAEYDAATCATDLCMLIPWSTQPQNMAFGYIHTALPLHYAAIHYERQGELERLAWCRQVSQNLSEKFGMEIRYPE